MGALADAEITEALKALPGWSFDGERISKEFKFEAFMDAIAFINRVAEAAEEADHHPDLENHYNRVLVAFRSWDAGGVTKRDIRMAATTETAVA